MRKGIQTELELRAAREKLDLLEERFEQALRKGGSDSEVEQLAFRSLKLLVNQLVEEIVRYEAHAGRRNDPESLLAKCFPVVIAPREYRPMIPQLDDNGNLPPGVHRASLAEIEERFGRGSEVRHVELQSLRWLVEVAAKAGVRRLVVNGSFTTEDLEPNDVDCVLLVAPDFPQDQEAERELLAGFPFLHIQLVRQSEFDLLVRDFFATDKRGRDKGMIEVIL